MKQNCLQDLPKDAGLENRERIQRIDWDYLIPNLDSVAVLLQVVEGGLFFFLTYIPLCQDDIIDDVDSFVAAAETLKERGAYKIFVMATHGILSCEAPRFIEESAIDEVGPLLLRHRSFLVSHPLPSVSPPHSGGGDQHDPPRAPEAAVSQDQNGGHQHDPVGGHPPHPQRRVHVLPVPQHRRGRLTRGTSAFSNLQQRYAFFVRFFAESPKGCGKRDT